MPARLCQIPGNNILRHAKLPSRKFPSSHRRRHSSAHPYLVASFFLTHNRHFPFSYTRPTQKRVLINYKWDMNQLMLETGHKWDMSPQIRLRNPLTAETFHRTGAVEICGRGTNRVAEMCRAAGVPAPAYEEIGGSVLVTFRVRVGSTARIDIQNKADKAGLGRSESEARVGSLGFSDTDRDPSFGRPGQRAIEPKRHCAASRSPKRFRGNPESDLGSSSKRMD